MPRSLVDVFKNHVETRGDRVAYRFSDGQHIVATYSFSDIDRAARTLASALQQRCRVGDRVLLLTDSGADFVRALFGCLYAGVIAVPLNLPVGPRGVAKIHAVARNAAAPWLLANARVFRALDIPSLGVEGLDIASLVEDGDGTRFRDENLGPDHTAFIQYTSGSNGTPKGVVVTHGNLLANEQTICDSCAHNDDSAFVGWLPLFHDMGLVGNILQPAYVGISSTLMPPAAFIRRPRRWLQLISDYRATTSGGPNFAYDTCVRRIDDAQIDGLDLRSWRIAFNGAEPIRARTLDAFARKFAHAGFSYKAFYPVYGLAEATLMVAANDAGTAPRVRRIPAAALEEGTVPRGDASPDGEARLREVVSCGRPRAGQTVRIVHPAQRRTLEERQVGEIWLAGPNVTRGYWNNDALSREAFGTTTNDGAGPFLMTGDLGFLDDGELYVTGRIKDVLIINGKNHYPQDIEQTATACDAAFAGRQAAALALEEHEREVLAVLQEVPRTFLARRTDEERLARINELKAKIRQALTSEHGLIAKYILFLRQGALPITTSGKIQRAQCRELLATGQLKEIWAPRSQAGASAGEGR